MTASKKHINTSQNGAVRSEYQPRMFEFRGRIGRVRYLVYSLGIVLLYFGLIAIYADIVPLLVRDISLYNNLSFLFIPFMILMAVMWIVHDIRRLNDLNVTGWACLLSLVPLINVIFYLALLFLPGTKGNNNFGRPPLHNQPLILFALVVMILVSLTPLALIGLRMYST